MTAYHKFRPGPVWWEWQCLECDQAREEHVSWVYRAWRWIMGHRSAA